MSNMQNTSEQSQHLLNLSNPDLLKQQCLIKDGWHAASNTETIEVSNPFTQNIIGHVPSLTSEDVNAAVDYAHEAQREWAAKTPQERCDILQKWADLIDANKEDLAILMTAEQGKPLTESRGEISYANSFIRWFGEEGKRVYGDVIPATKSQLRYVVLKQPIGVCAAITPWNFPAAMITRKAAPALAAGCTMIIKPATETPFSALALGVLAEQAGIPAGVIQVVTGKSSVIGDILTGDARIRKLSFTGSTEVGRTLMAQCAPTIKKLSLELGGNAPFIVFDDADLEKAADGLIASKFRNAGQTCVCANRVYVQDSVKDKFLDIFVKKVAKLSVGDGMQEGVDIGPMINQKALDKVQALLKDALDKGATLIAGGSTNEASALSYNPTIVTDLNTDMDIAREEIFGPIATIFTFTDESEAIRLANDTIYGLAAYFYCSDYARAWRVTEGLEYGIVGHNTGLISTEVAPFGGVKQSGFGREGSKYGIDEYVVTKYWCSDVS
ncbi:NAD-dependent succinate-semialdehyde dehydrogenase [Psychrobacter sp. DM4]|uniref:NAD-dependent succinate-semialdehyde dehydrogenase n=1 Tax=Psychrobacter sp. DM4 TaxID=3440637 RepID=UPI003F507411